MFQNVTDSSHFKSVKQSKTVYNSRMHAECSRMHEKYSRMLQNELAFRYMNLHAVT